MLWAALVLGLCVVSAQEADEGAVLVEDQQITNDELNTIPCEECALLVQSVVAALHQLDPALQGDALAIRLGEMRLVFEQMAFQNGKLSAFAKSVTTTVLEAVCRTFAGLEGPSRDAVDEYFTFNVLCFGKMGCPTKFAAVAARNRRYHDAFQSFYNHFAAVYASQQQQDEL